MDNRIRKISEAIGRALEKGINFDDPALIILDGELFVVIKDERDNLVVEEIGDVISDIELETESILDNYTYDGTNDSPFDYWTEEDKGFKDKVSDIFKKSSESYNPDNYKKRRGKDE